MIHVIIPTYNRLNYTISCIESLKKQTNSKILNIIIVDDASTDNTCEYINKAYPEITLLNGNGFLFWGGAVNHGIKYVLKISKPQDWILLVNNDVELSSNAISKLIIESEKMSRKAVVGSLSINYIDKKTVIKCGSIVTSWFFNITKHIYENIHYDQILSTEPVQVDFITGRCLLHPVEIFKFTGNYDAKTFNHYGADDEFSMRIKKFGYSVLVCPSSIVFLKPNKKNDDHTKNLKNLYHTLFSIKSSSNIINKFWLTIKVVPFYSKLSFFMIGILKSLYLFIRRRL